VVDEVEVTTRHDQVGGAARAARGSVVVLAGLGLVAWAWAGTSDPGMSLGEATLLGIIEGLTEYLPVSSTGHLTVTQELLGITDTERGRQAANAYAVIIQAGAIAAVGFLYRAQFVHVLRSMTGSGTPHGRRLGAALAAGFVPAGIAGFLLGDLIKDRLFGIWPTVAAWAVGGVVLLVWSRHERSGTRPLDSIGARDGLLIGCAQVLALWPGTSRSLVTILGALALGFTLRAAVEFSFLLGFVTLGTATVYEALQSGSLVVDEFGWQAPALGFLAATLSAAAAVMWMLRYLERRGLGMFGWYRLGIAAVVGGLALTIGL
jgi:undecaprenyl-diphosphatase